MGCFVAQSGWRKSFVYDSVIAENIEQMYHFHKKLTQ